MATKKQQSEQADARATLRTWIKPGDTIFTVMRHVSRSGTQREIDLLKIELLRVDKVDGSEILWLSGMAGKALGLRRGKHDGGLVVTGCGMDMGFHLVYELSSVLFHDGFGCIGEGNDYGTRCPSNDHSNGDRDYTPHALTAEELIHGRGYKHWHRNGGYALRHRWI